MKKEQRRNKRYLRIMIIIKKRNDSRRGGGRKKARSKQNCRGETRRRNGAEATDGAPKGTRKKRWEGLSATTSRWVARGPDRSTWKPSGRTNEVNYPSTAPLPLSLSLFAEHSSVLLYANGVLCRLYNAD